MTTLIHFRRKKIKAQSFGGLGSSSKHVTIIHYDRPIAQIFWKQICGNPFCIPEYCNSNYAEESMQDIDIS